MNLLTVVKVNCRWRLTTKALKFYSVARNLHNIGKRILQWNSTLQHRLKEAEKCLRTPTFIETKVNNAKLNFLLSQMKSQTKKLRGRRYCVNDKIFALSLFKQSPKCYRLLQKTFALLSRNSLMKLLYRIPFQVGINEAIMRSLEKCTMKMEPLDRVYSLIFEEISFTLALSYNQKDDLIKGFLNTGSDRKAVFTDHGMVFMLRGLHKKWKQPVAYYFVQTSMECAVLMKIKRTYYTYHSSWFQHRRNSLWSVIHQCLSNEGTEERNYPKFPEGRKRVQRKWVPREQFWNSDHLWSSPSLKVYKKQFHR